MKGNWFPVETDESKIRHAAWELACKERDAENKRRGY